MAQSQSSRSYNAVSLTQGEHELTTAALAGLSPSGVFDQNLTHEARRNGNESERGSAIQEVLIHREQRLP